MKVKELMMETPYYCPPEQTWGRRPNSCGMGTADFFPWWILTVRSAVWLRTGTSVLLCGQEGPKISRGQRAVRPHLLEGCV